MFITYVSLLCTGTLCFLMRFARIVRGWSANADFGVPSGTGVKNLNFMGLAVTFPADVLGLRFVTAFLCLNGSMSSEVLLVAFLC